MNTAQQFPVQNICSMLVQQQKEMFEQMHRQLCTSPGLQSPSSSQAGPAGPALIDVAEQSKASLQKLKPLALKSPSCAELGESASPGLLLLENGAAIVGGSKPLGADEHAMDEPMDVDCKPDMVQVN